MWKRDFADVVKGTGLDVRKVPWIIQMGPTQSLQSLRVENLAALRARWRFVRTEGRCPGRRSWPPVAGFEGGERVPRAGEWGEPLEARKGEESVVPWSLQKGTQPRWHPGFCPVRPMLDFWYTGLEDNKLYCFKLLYLWQSVTAVKETKYNFGKIEMTLFEKTDWEKEAGGRETS